MVYEIIIIGAGPYGLSAGVHLKAKGFHVRVYGEPMEFWASKMPEGMLLRSPRVASSISDPARQFTLEDYEVANGLQPSAPVPLDTFVDYGRWFQKQLGTDLDRRSVASVEKIDSGFEVTLEDGEVVRSARVVVAAGIGPFRRIPTVFERLGPEYLSHCYEGRDVKRFKNKRVAVIGAGQSALESAALLHEAGADVEIVARIPQLRWIGRYPRLHKLGPISSVFYSKHDIGPFGISRLVAAPNLVAQFPLKLRDKIRTRAVRAAGSQWLPARLAKVKISNSRYVTSATPHGQELSLRLDDQTERSVDHILLGTGYDVDISRFEFLSPSLLTNVARLSGYPKLTRGFSTSVKGLHFIGATAARSFGPLLYFVTGTEFASRELTSYIVKNRGRKVVVPEPSAELVAR